MQGGLYCIFLKTSIQIFEYSNMFTSLLWYKGLGYFDLKKLLIINFTKAISTMKQ